MKKQINAREPEKFKKFKHINATILDSLKSEALFLKFIKYLYEKDTQALNEWLKFRNFDPKLYPGFKEIAETLKAIGVLTKP